MASKAAEVAKLLALQEKERKLEDNKKNDESNTEILDKSLISWENALDMFVENSSDINEELKSFLHINTITDKKEESKLLLENLNNVLSPILNNKDIGTKVNPMVITFDKTSAEMIQTIGEDKKENKPSIINSQNPDKIIKDKNETENNGIDLKQLLTGMNTILSKLLNPVAFFTSIVAEFLPYFILGFFFLKGFLNSLGIDIMNVIKPALAVLGRFISS